MSGSDTVIPDSAPVTVIIHRTVKPGREAEFERWMDGVTKSAMRYPGHLGVEVLRPAPGEREWVLIYRFDTYQNLRHWTESPERMEWVAKADLICEEHHLHVVTGLEHWFTLPRRHAPDAPSPPPRWKMAIVTWLAVYPLVNILNVVLAPMIGRQPDLLRTMATTTVFVPAMTWVVMPGMTRIFLRWLYPALRAWEARNEARSTPSHGDR